MADKNLKITPPKDTAAGFSSIKSAVKRVNNEMGIVRGSRALLAINQKGSIDCQSCAWPDPDRDRSISEFCENGAKAMADEGTTKRVTPEFFAKHTVKELAAQSDHWINAQGRLTHPMILKDGAEHYTPISWEEAFKIIGDELNSLDLPDEAIFYTSGRTSNEAAFLYQLFVRLFGTNNLPDCSNMCHESTSVALAESIGLGKATIRLDDFEKTDLVIVIGQNPGTNAPRMLSSLQTAKQNGAKMIAVNPLPEAGLMNFINPNPQHYRNPLKFPLALFGNEVTPLADLHLPIRIGGDMAFLKGMMKALLEMEQQNTGKVFAHNFIKEKTEGFEEFIAGLESISWNDTVSQSGLPKEQILQAAEMFAKANRVITCWAMGITQHTDAVATIQDIVNLHLLFGQIGKPGAGLCPVRGHSNVQGDRTMGIWEKMNPVFRENLEKEFDFKTPEKDGFNTVEAIEAMHNGKAKVFFAMGGNFLSASPDTEFTAKALSSCNLTVQVITKLNRTALTPGKGSLILPCLGRSEKDIQASGEQFVSTESTMLNVQMSKGIFEPASEHLRSEPWIVCQLAKAVLEDESKIDWDGFCANYENIRSSISRVIPGFENYNERIKNPGGFYLPNPPSKGEFTTPSGKAQFKTSQLNKIDLESGQLMLTTIRSHDQFNTTIYGLEDRYRGVAGGRHVIFMNKEDIAERGLKAGQEVNITSHFEDGERHAKGFTIVPYPIPKDCAAAYFPEANVLVPIKSRALRSNTPTSKLIIITASPA